MSPPVALYPRCAMAVIQSRPPRDGGSSRSWTWFDVPRPYKADAWIAGPTVWVETHFVGRTVPCRHTMTDGALACGYDHHKCRLIQVGYVPFFDAGGKRWFLIVQDYGRPLIDRLPMYGPVTIQRGKDKYDAVQLLPRSGSSWARAKDDPRGGHDITPALLCIWGDVEYERWCYQQLGQELPPAPPPKTAKPAAVDGQELNAEESQALRREAVLRRLAVDGNPLADGEVPWQDLVRSLRTKVEKNGKPK